MADWVTISSLATAGGTLVLAVATFSAVRSSNRSARVAELSLLTGMRPVLIPSREDDPDLRVRFGDDHNLILPGHGGALEADSGNVYLALSLRNGGSGLAVLHSWRVEAFERERIAVRTNEPQASGAGQGEMCRHQRPHAMIVRPVRICKGFHRHAQGVLDPRLCTG